MKHPRLLASKIFNVENFILSEITEKAYKDDKDFDWEIDRKKVTDYFSESRRKTLRKRMSSNCTTDELNAHGEVHIPAACPNKETQGWSTNNENPLQTLLGLKSIQLVFAPRSILSISNNKRSVRA